MKEKVLSSKVIKSYFTLVTGEMSLWIAEKSIFGVDIIWKISPHLVLARWLPAAR